MPEFQLDTSGPVDTRPRTSSPTTWNDLDAFTKGYIEAMFFTADEELADASFNDLAPAQLEAIRADCASFKDSAVHIEPLMGEDDMPDAEHAGRDFWYTRNGHGCGFWDGDWPEPYASDLTTLAKTFRVIDVYLGDDGLIYLA